MYNESKLFLLKGNELKTKNKAYGKYIHYKMKL